MPPPPTLPRSGYSESTLIIRTAFDDESAWTSLVDAAATPSPDGFLANIATVDLEAYRDMSPEDLQTLLPGDDDVSFFFVADRRAIDESGHPLLVIPVEQPDHDPPDRLAREPFRVVITSLWAVENNLSLANMDWEDFTSRCLDGVFREY